MATVARDKEIEQALNRLALRFALLAARREIGEGVPISEAETHQDQSEVAKLARLAERPQRMNSTRYGYWPTSSRPSRKALPIHTFFPACLLKVPSTRSKRGYQRSARETRLRRSFNS